MQHERRPAQIEVRAAKGGRRLEGHAALFGVSTRIGGFTESIKAGAFRRSLAAGGDILGLVDHDPGRLLARTRSGSLRLSEDSRGLAFSLDVPDTTVGRDVLALAERGDIGGASFAFTLADDGDEWSGDHRTLRNVVLHEISVVQSWPAYPDTHVDARARSGGQWRVSLGRRWLAAIGG